MQPATQNDIKRLERRIEVLGSDTRTDMTRLEVLWEHDLEQIRAMFNDIMSYVKEIPDLKLIREHHDLEIRMLNRAVFGYDSILDDTQRELR